MKITKLRRWKQGGLGELITSLQQPPSMIPRMDENGVIVGESWHGVFIMAILLMFVCSGISSPS